MYISINIFWDVLDEHNTEILQDGKNKNYLINYDNLYTKFTQ
jgi:hypothetical protein